MSHPGPTQTHERQLALVIDLNKCVGCHACAVSCKSWNSSGRFGPMTEVDPYGAKPDGVWFNRVQTYEIGEFPDVETLHLPKSCMHCVDAPCVPVCPTGASLKRAEDGIVLVDYDQCIGCKYCSWACPYGCREFDHVEGIMKKCSLCVDRIYDKTLDEEARRPACVIACPTGARLFGDVSDPKSEAREAIHSRGGYRLAPESGANPANHYLPKRSAKINLPEDALTRHRAAQIKPSARKIDDKAITLDDILSAG